MKKTRYYCDLCKEEGSNHPKQIQVIFTTEQQQGKNCEPYLSTEKIDICGVCEDKLLKGNYIFATGAMGFNEYFFKRDK